MLLTVGMGRTISDDTAPDAGIPVSEELFAPVNRDVELCYQTFGDPDGEPVLLVMGLGGPMTWWDPEFCRMLAARGCYVIRYDNRDTGRSTRVKERVRRPALVRAFAGRGGRPPYTLGDMADDGFGLLDHLGLDGRPRGRHLDGRHDRADDGDPPPRPGALADQHHVDDRQALGGLAAPSAAADAGRPARRGRDAYAEGSARMWAVIGSPAFPQEHGDVIARAHETFDRGVSASGVMRQMLAILHEGDRGPRLRSLRMPALVIHGAADRMVHVSGGRATARALPGAELLVIDGMGHDLPADLYPTFVDAIDRTIRRAG